MSELDLFGNPIRETPKLVVAPKVVAPTPVQDATAPYRPCTIRKTGKLESFLINDDCKHLFK
jgi:hypothetical protein